MKTSAKILLLLVSCLSLFASACKKDEKITPPISFDQIALTDITAHEAEFSAQNTGSAIYYENPAEARNFKVGSILFLKGEGIIHYAKLEITSVSASEVKFNFMAYNPDGSVLVAKKLVIIGLGQSTFSSLTGLYDAQPAVFSVGFSNSPTSITTSVIHHIIVFRL